MVARRLTAFLLLLVCATHAPLASAQQVVVRVLIERTSWFNCDDGPFGGPPEIYFKVIIDGHELNSRNDAIFTNFSPFAVNREFSQPVDFASGSVPIRIEQWDRDSGLTFDDDRCDISPNGDELDLTLDLINCQVSGEASGACATTLAGRTPFEFQVTVDEPPSAPGLQTSCIHDPIWPQPGETVTITANALDGTLAPRLADSIEIWVDDRTGPATASPGTTLSFTAGPFSAETFTYGCRVIDDGLSIWTGWRTVAVGTSALTDAYGDRIPIMYTGSRSSRLDFVFYADRDSYSSSSDPAFLNDVRNAISNGYYADAVYLTNQDKINYWLAQATGKADPDCEIDAPTRAWEDVGLVFHTDDFRDCAPGGKRVFSTEPASFGTIRHETGHRPFGLADEYCCDGGYFQTSPFPDIYDSRTAVMLPGGGVIIGCEDDAVNVGRTAADCRSWDEDIPWWFDDTWYTSDPDSDDLMFDRGQRRALDDRRMNWLFDVCRGAAC